MLNVKRFETALSEQCVTRQLERLASLDTLDVTRRLETINKQLGALAEGLDHVRLVSSPWRAGVGTEVHNGGRSWARKQAVEPLPKGIMGRDHYPGLKVYLEEVKMLDVTHFENTMTESHIEYLLDRLPILSVVGGLDSVGDRLHVHGTVVCTLDCIRLTPSYWKDTVKVKSHVGGHRRSNKLAAEPLPEGVVDQRTCRGLKL